MNETKCRERRLWAIDPKIVGNPVACTLFPDHTGRHEAWDSVGLALAWDSAGARFDRFGAEAPGLITPQQAAHVLHMYGAGGEEPGSFSRNLIITMQHADLMNLALLESSFPGYVEAVRWAKMEQDGIRWLNAILLVEGRRRKAAES